MFLTYVDNSFVELDYYFFFVCFQNISCPEQKEPFLVFFRKKLNANGILGKVWWWCCPPNVIAYLTGEKEEGAFSFKKVPFSFQLSIIFQNFNKLRITLFQLNT